MTDDTIEIVQPLDNHPCNSPRGMLYYDLNVLTEDQQTDLREFKLDVIRDDERYLATHPELRALVALISRYVLLKRPRTNLHECVGKFMSRPKPDINEEIERYISERGPHVYEGNSAVVIHGESSEESVESEEEESLKFVSKEMLDQIISRVYRQFGFPTDYDADITDAEQIVEKVSSTKLIIKAIISDIIECAVTRADVLRYLQSLKEPEEEQFDYKVKPRPITSEMDYSDMKEEILQYLRSGSLSPEEGYQDQA